MADHLPHSHLTDYEELTRIYQMVRANFEPGVMVDKSFLRKIEELVQRHTWTGDIGTGKAHLLDEKTLDKIAGDDKPDTVKVFNRIKAIEATIEDKAALQPYLITIGERAEQVAEAFKERQKATFDALRELMELVREYQEAERSREETHLSPEAFAVYWKLKRQGVDGAEAISGKAAEAFENYPTGSGRPTRKRWCHWICTGRWPE